MIKGIVHRLVNQKVRWHCHLGIFVIIVFLLSLAAVKSCLRADLVHILRGTRVSSDMDSFLIFVVFSHQDIIVRNHNFLVGRLDLAVVPHGWNRG